MTQTARSAPVTTDLEHFMGEAMRGAAARSILRLSAEHKATCDRETCDVVLASLLSVVTALLGRDLTRKERDALL